MDDESKIVKIEFTYDPTHKVRYAEFPLTARLYEEIFKINGSTKEDVVFDCLSDLVEKKDPVIFLETMSELGSTNMVIHDRNMFIYQLIHQMDCSSTHPDDIEGQVNRLLLGYVAREGNCQGLNPPQELDVRIKKNLPEICRELSIHTIDVINGSLLVEGNVDYQKALETIKSWKSGFYLKNSLDSNGRGMRIFVPENSREFELYVKAVLDILNCTPDTKNIIITKRIETPHKKYASHYGVFTFFDGNKAHILSAILCYNKDNKYTVHGPGCAKIPITGDYTDNEKSRDEERVLKAHGLKEIELPEKVRDISIKVSEYAGRMGRLFLGSEIIEDVDNNFYLMDVNGAPGLGAIRTTEFAPGTNPSLEKLCRKTAEMMLDCYEKKD